MNVFLAIDIDIPLDEMDAGSRSIEFALASNAIVYVIPKIGDNLGVGIEVGSVLEALFRERAAVAPQPPWRVIMNGYCLYTNPESEAQ